jgi:hypothetical protein
VTKHRDWLLKENAFLRGKTERLEMSLLSDKSAAGRKYVERTEDEQQVRPAIGDTPLVPTLKTRHQTTLEAWNALSPDQQEKVMHEGNWNPGEEVEVEERKQKHARRH